ncbi:MAG: UDP-N-acetylmuramoyl-tripeptide--D-alanyl-D-alanine ligase [Deltaproteobacteria bacterium]|jgi:UDP-N-acetylmuramoyl-tripeptide--D-alanyl-D-alanine ligase|nr:UDP-N-acetylmuramoyl-tripeptide--D-alanyl-D-alanine ligase [Deltaproteobacteria bacterium]
MFELKKLKVWMEATILQAERTEFLEVASDTRKDLKGKLFFALRGENFDAHQFLEKAIEQGAAGLVIDKSEKFDEIKEKSKSITVFLVKDTLTALQSLAHEYRLALGTKIISITGSNGKTTAKEFTAQVLSVFFKTHFNSGSYNNHWGVPFSLLALKPEHEIGIIEIGMSHPHEIEKLVKIACPQIVVCTMVGNAHIEHFGTVEKIAEAKEEIYKYSDPNGIKIFNLDNEHTYKMYVKYGFNRSQAFTFSTNRKEADVFMKVNEFKIDSLTIEGSILGVKNTIQVPIFGEQNITNIMVAATIAIALRVQPERVWDSLKGLSTNWGRNQFLQSDIGGKILFDGYNANSDSMKSLLLNFSKLKTRGKKIAVLAEMLEQGDMSAECHKNLGIQVANSGFDIVFFYGKPWKEFKEGVDSVNKSQNIFYYPDFNNEMITKIKELETSESLICIKGSRGMKTERVVQGLVKTFSGKYI